VSDDKLDLTALMKQAQELSAKLQRAQEELRHRTVSATVGGGNLAAGPGVVCATG